MHWLENNCPRPAIVRSLREGNTEFFGGFNPVFPTGHPGWILRTISAHGKVRYIAVIAYQNKYGIRILRDVPWGNWIGTGDITGEFKTILYSGDHPTEYWELREAWNEYNR
ncbi:hypothetical protein KAR91_41035 [Candidatus Pacearchaeota archaeon]|nr:hypothetical protein [Candidatus Pacearchaeota archaeon]